MRGISGPIRRGCECNGSFVGVFQSPASRRASSVEEGDAVRGVEIDLSLSGAALSSIAGAETLVALEAPGAPGGRLTDDGRDTATGRPLRFATIECSIPSLWRSDDYLAGSRIHEALSGAQAVRRLSAVKHPFA